MKVSLNGLKQDKFGKVMKVNELMIGDWITIIPDEGDDYNKQWSINDYIDTNVDYCEPIPLTEEMLEVNGLHTKKIQKHRNKFEYDNWTITINKYRTWFCLYIEHCIDDEYDYDLRSLPITYVHELQHALRFLCDLYELADNFKIN